VTGGLRLVDAQLAGAFASAAVVVLEGLTACGKTANGAGSRYCVLAALAMTRRRSTRSTGSWLAAKGLRTHEVGATAMFEPSEDFRVPPSRWISASTPHRFNPPSSSAATRTSSAERISGRAR
jgi:hypothetical protein